MTAEQTLAYIIKILKVYLDDLKSVPSNDFIDGEVTAYVDCLEMISRWKNAKNEGLNFSLSDKYPL